MGGDCLDLDFDLAEKGGLYFLYLCTNFAGVWFAHFSDVAKFTAADRSDRSSQISFLSY